MKIELLLANKFKEIRKQQQMTQCEFAEYLSEIIGSSISTQMVSEVENGRKVYHTEAILKIAKEMNVSVQYLLGFGHKDRYPASERNETFGQRIKMLRKAKKIKLIDAGNLYYKSGVLPKAYSSSRIVNIEHDRGTMPILKIHRLAKFYDVPIDYLLGLTDETNQQVNMCTSM